MKESVAESIEKFPDYVIEASKLNDVKIIGEVNKILVVGMGGSGIAGDLLKSYVNELGLRIPVFTNKDFEIPAFADSKTLVFIVCYSGNTLEALKCYKEAVGRGCKIVAITSGGKLRELCKQNNVEFIKIPENLQPRAALPFLFIPMLNVLRNMHLIEEVDFSEISSVLRKSFFKEKASETAKRLINKIPIIYSSKRFEGVALRWKQAFNENSKIPAFYNTFPELCHNEIEAYEEKFENAFVIIIRDDYDSKYVKREMDIFRTIVSKKVESTELHLKGTDYLKKVFSAIYLGDIISVELSEFLEKNPDEIKLISELKSKMKGIY